MLISVALPQTTEITVLANRTLSETLQTLGDPETVVLRALRHYLLDLCLQRLEQARHQIQHYGVTAQPFLAD